MPNVNVGYGIDSTHDISLSDGVNTYGLIYAQGGVKILQEIPLSPPASAFAISAEGWIGGRGRVRYVDDPTGFFDSGHLWSTSENRLFPSPQWRFSDGIRSHTLYMPADNQTYAWWKLYGNTPASQIALYLETSFTPSASYTAEHNYLIIRRRGTPGTLTVEICSDSAGDPNTVLQTITKTVSDVTDTLAIYLDFAASQALTGSTVYHIKIYGAGTDDSSNYWEVLTNDDGSNSQYSSDNSTWAAAGVSMYYRITDADTLRQWYFFTLQGGTYAICRYDDGTTPKLYLNGIRGTATSGTSTSIVDTGLSMTVDAYIGAYIRIIDGTGNGQVREIVSNTATAFTVAAWDITPDSTSVFVVYASDYWTEITTTGITAITGKPALGAKIAYFPQGASDTKIRRMRVNGNSHDFSDDATGSGLGFDLLHIHAEGTTPRMYGADSDGAWIAHADTQAWGTNLSWGSRYFISTSDYDITNMISANKLLYVFKEDGIYTFSNNVIEQLGNFGDSPDHTTGLGAAVKDNYLWFGWSHSIERMVGASITDMMNFKLGYDGMADDKRGYISSIVSAIGWLFVSICGDSDNYSSILIWNGYGWHEIYKSWKKNALIRNLHWQANIGTRPRLWFDVDGDLAYMELPKQVANPLRDTTFNYSPEGMLVTPTYDARDPQLYKVFALLRVYSEQGTCEIDYQTNSNVDTDTWTVLGSANTQPVTDLTLDLGGVLKIRFRMRLQAAHSYTPCILTGWQASGRMMPLDKYQWVGTFRADTTGDTLQDEPDYDPETIYNQIQTWAQQQTKLTLRSTSESMDNKTITVSLPSKSVDWIDEKDWGGRLSFAMLET